MLGKNSYSKKVDFVFHLKIDKNEKLVSLKKKKNCVFYSKFGPPKMSLLPCEMAQNGQTTEAREKEKSNKVAWDDANNLYVNHFSK